MRDGNDLPRALNAADKEKIAAQIVSEVLHTERHPVVRFLSTEVSKRRDGGRDITGTLTLCGKSRKLTCTTRVRDGRQVAVIDIHQPDFGIKPFRAMMGTLKVQPRVRVQVVV